MTLTPTADLVADAVTRGGAVAAFNVLGLETAQAILRGAQDTDQPVILQISENCVRHHGGLRPLALATLALAEESGVAAAVHLDHAEDPGLVEEAVALGFGSVMIDASTLPYADNVALTAEVARRCRAAGVMVEAELGEIGGKERGGAHAPGVRTDPAQAADFVQATGVQALAVAVGSRHAMTERSARLDTELIARLARAVPVPLVLHGSSGVADEGLAEAVRAGIRKINLSTRLNAAFTGAVRDRLGADPALVDPRRYLKDGRSAMAEEVAVLLRVISDAA